MSKKLPFWKPRPRRRELSRASPMRPKPRGWCTFIGQITASIAFIVYSWLLGNWVFVVTNALMLVTAIIGQWVYLINRQQAAAG